MRSRRLGVARMSRIESEEQGTGRSRPHGLDQRREFRRQHPAAERVEFGDHRVGRGLGEGGGEAVAAGGQALRRHGHAVGIEERREGGTDDAQGRQLHQAHAVEAGQGHRHAAGHQRHRVAGRRESPRQGGRPGQVPGPEQVRDGDQDPAHARDARRSGASVVRRIAAARSRPRSSRAKARALARIAASRSGRSARVRIAGGEEAGVAGRRHPAGRAVPHHVRHTAVAAGHHRAAMGLRLQERHAVGLVDGRPDQEVGGGVEGRERVGRHAPCRRTRAPKGASRSVTAPAAGPSPATSRVQGTSPSRARIRPAAGRRRACRPRASSRR